MRAAKMPAATTLSRSKLLTRPALRSHGCLCRATLDAHLPDVYSPGVRPRPGGVPVKGKVALSSITLAAVLTVLSAFAGCASLSSPSAVPEFTAQSRCERDGNVWWADRKSTRLNSSHRCISYA